MSVDLPTHVANLYRACTIHSCQTKFCARRRMAPPSVRRSCGPASPFVTTEIDLLETPIDIFKACQLLRRQDSQLHITGCESPPTGACTFTPNNQHRHQHNLGTCREHLWLPREAQKLSAESYFSPRPRNPGGVDPRYRARSRCGGG